MLLKCLGARLILRQRKGESFKACLFLTRLPCAVLRTFKLASSFSVASQRAASITSRKPDFRISAGPLLVSSRTARATRRSFLWSQRRYASVSRWPNTSPEGTSNDVPSDVAPSPRMICWIGPTCDIIFDQSSKGSQSRELPEYPHFTKMKSSLQFLTTPTVDTQGTSLFLHFDSKRYIIGNAHEGIQRACIQRGFKLNRVSDVFLTGKTEWKNIGGIIGVILTTADGRKSAAESAEEVVRIRERAKRERYEREIGAATGRAKENLKRRRDEDERRKTERAERAAKQETQKDLLTIHGGINLMHTIATGRRFVFRKGMPVEVDEIREGASHTDWTPTWADENIRVYAMPIEPTGSISTSASESRSPRKRSFGDYVGEQAVDPSNILSQQDGSISQGIENPEIRKQKILKSIIGDMFDSDWRLDALIETHISKVSMPATLFFRDAETKAIKKYEGPKPGDNVPLPDLNVLVRRPWPGALIANLPGAKPSATSMSYVIKNHPQRGKFLAQKAKELGVPTNKFRDLASGQAVEVNSIVVQPEQVLEKGKPGGGFAIVELPSCDYIQNLIDRPEWESSIVMEGVEAIVWVLGPGVAQDETLQRFIRGNARFQHVISSSDHSANYLSLDSAAAAAIRLNLLDPDRYPVPDHNNTRIPLPPALSGCLVANRGTTLQLEPTVKFDGSTSVEPLNTAVVIEKVPQSVLAIAGAIRKEISSREVQNDLANQGLPSPEAEIIALGTGSALPSKYRNVSATLLRVPGSGSYLLDAGENTLGQLSRVYGPQELCDVLRDLKLIWISHMHADHHLGTAGVIRAWYKATYGDNYYDKDMQKVSLTEQLLEPAKYIGEQNEPRLCVVSDQPMLQWLEEYSAVEDFGYNKLLPINIFGAQLGRPDSTIMRWMGVDVGFRTISPRLNKAMRKATGLINIQAANVPHCHGAKAVALTFPTGFKFSYSGDCRPSKGFVEIGQGSTVLLHEATFDDDLRGDAQAKLHSTTSEAIGVGIAMGARRVLLTHFSQRYQKIPVMETIDSIDLQLEEPSGNAADELATATDPADLPAEVLMAVDPTERSQTMPTLGKRKSFADMVEDGADLDDFLADDPAARDDGRNGRATIRKYDSVYRKAMRNMKVGVAFDYMRVKVKDIALLEKFTPALLKLFEVPEPEANEENADAATAEGTHHHAKKPQKEATRKPTLSGPPRKSSAVFFDARSTTVGGQANNEPGMSANDALPAHPDGRIGTNGGMPPGIHDEGISIGNYFRHSRGQSPTSPHQQGNQAITRQENTGRPSTAVVLQNDDGRPEAKMSDAP